MIGLVWLAVAWLSGWRWSNKLLGDPAVLLYRSGRPRSCEALDASPWPRLFFMLSLALWAGVLPLTWITYILAAVLSPLLPAFIHPLFVTNCLVMAIAGIWLAVPFLRRKMKSPWSWATLKRSVAQPGTLFFLITLFIWIVFATWLMTSTFWRSGTFYHAGYSVFSDFAPHTALVSSFAQGRNWPTEYPHFPNDGIAYHFIFYFLCGNLNFLGLPLDLAINLPSILGSVTFCLLLGTLAMLLTGRRAAFLLAPAMLFLRSSMAFFTFLRDLARQYGTAPAAWPDIGAALLRQSVFIGNTTHDNWGLWGINVYANQRHLLPGLAVALIVFMLLLPDLQKGLAQRPNWRELLFSRNFWLIRGAEAKKRLAAAIFFCLMLPYFHGSVLVALLLVLAGIAIFSCNRLSFLLVAAISMLSALLQSLYFTGQATRVVQPAIQIGFIAADKSLTGIISYLLEMSGILLPLLLLAFWLPGRRRKILIASFLLPLIFALTVSLTPDITVNHKYIMISFALGNIYLADLLLRLWPARHLELPGKISARRAPFAAGQFVKRLAAVFLASILMITGLQEIIIENNINQNTVAIDENSPLVKWIMNNTRPDAVFVTAPYHYNAFYLSGRSTWLGHAYYALSAGHDTYEREQDEIWLFSGCGRDREALQQFVQREKLDYLLIDDTLRELPDFNVDEAFFDQNFTVIASFPALGNIKIYNLRQ